MSKQSLHSWLGARGEWTDNTPPQVEKIIYYSPTARTHFYSDSRTTKDLSDEAKEIVKSGELLIYEQLSGTRKRVLKKVIYAYGKYLPRCLTPEEQDRVDNYGSELVNI